MKVQFLKFAVLLCFLFVSNSIKSQKTDNTLDFQLNLLKQLQGIFQAPISKDTVEIWESQNFGDAFIINVSRKIEGKKIPLYNINIGFSPREGKLIGFILNSDATSFDWMGFFPTDKHLNYVMFFKEFDKSRISRSYDIEFKNSNEWTLTSLNKRFKPVNLKFIRVK
jgi:hypothetical protein